MLYNGGNVCWCEFMVKGARVRESSQTTDSKTNFRQSELPRRSELELSVSGIKREPPLFR